MCKGTWATWVGPILLSPNTASSSQAGRLLEQSYYSSWFYKSPRGFLTRQARLTYASNIGLNFRFLFRIQKNSYGSLDEIFSIIKIDKFQQNIRVINKIPTQTSDGYDYDYKLIYLLSGHSVVSKQGLLRIRH